MTQLSYRKKRNNKPQIIGVLLFLILFFTYQFHFKEKWFGDKNSSIDSKQIESILSKQENILTLDEWEKIADYRAQEYYECTKDLNLDITKSYIFEGCAVNYRNSWVNFRDGLENRANLNIDQITKLKDYWDKTSDEITKKITKTMEENDKKLRPNKY